MVLLPVPKAPARVSAFSNLLPAAPSPVWSVFLPSLTIREVDEGGDGDATAGGAADACPFRPGCAPAGVEDNAPTPTATPASVAFVSLPSKAAKNVSISVVICLTTLGGQTSSISIPTSSAST
jgi:hypothetical protein